MGRPRKRYQINDINLYVYLPKAGKKIQFPISVEIWTFHLIFNQLEDN